MMNVMGPTSLVSTSEGYKVNRLDLKKGCVLTKTRMALFIGSDICTCRPYLIYGIEECVKQAQQGGVGVIVYCK